MLKAANEAKVHTSWINPNEEYSAALLGFVRGALDPRANRAFLDDFTAFQRRVATYGQFNSLSQTLLKLTSPGMPDLYQGTELWDFSLVDPDNRRPVNYGLRRALLDDLKVRMAQDQVALVDDLLQNSHDGRIKLYLAHLALTFRRERETLFNSDSYIPLNAAGSKQQYVCAFARTSEDHTIIVAVPRLIVGLTDGIERPPLGGDVWTDTRLSLPRELAEGTYRNVFTGETLSPDKDSGFWMHTVLARFPVALLERVSL